MSSMRHRAVLLPLAVLAATSAGLPAGAQETGASDRVAEIVVTARKREEKLNEVPLAISAFTDDELAKRNIEGLADVAKYTAGFSFENYAGGTNPAPIIRGLTQNTLTDRNQNVGTFVDGIHVQQQGNIDMALMDVERIEILKGPQNSQYGRSAFAGAINYVSKKPVLGDWDGNAAVTVGTDERTEVRAGMSVPLWSDKLAMRLYGVKSEFDGTWENNFAGGDNGVWTKDGGFGNTFEGTDGNLGGWDNDAYQAQLRFNPLDTLRFDLGYFKSNVKNEQAALEFIRPNGSTLWGLDHQTNCNPSTATGLFRFVCGKLDVNADSVTVDPRSVGLYAETQLINFDAAWDVTDSVTATYQFGRNDLDTNSFSHSSNPPNPELEGCGFVASGTPPCTTGTPAILFQTGPQNQKATSHELRFDGKLFADALAWRLGYYHSEVNDESYLNSIETRRSLIQDPTGQIIVGAGPGFTQPRSLFDDTTDAVFGSVGYTFMDIYTVDVEARYSAEEREYTPTNIAQKLPPRTFYDFTPRVSLKAQVTPDFMTYVSAAKGSKAGGFNTVTADPGFETYDQETNWTYELGAKQTLLDGSLQLNYDVFYIDWKDLQLSTADLIPTNTTTNAADANFISNASGATSWGVELEAVYLVDDHWTVNFAGSYANPEFDDGTLDFGLGAQCANSSDPVCPSVTVVRPNATTNAFASPIGGNQLARTPKVKLAGGLEYRGMLADWEYAARGDLSYQDKQYAEVLNLAYLPSRTLLDLNFTMTMPNRQWAFTLWGKNVTDEEYVSNSFVVGFNNTYGASLAPGAAWGLTARYNFAGK
jgi:iron complex outermembrane receptor protein